MKNKYKINLISAIYHEFALKLCCIKYLLLCIMLFIIGCSPHYTNKALFNDKFKLNLKDYSNSKVENYEHLTNIYFPKCNIKYLSTISKENYGTNNRNGYRYNLKHHVNYVFHKGYAGTVTYRVKKDIVIVLDVIPDKDSSIYNAMLQHIKNTSKVENYEFREQYFTGVYKFDNSLIFYDTQELPNPHYTMNIYVDNKLLCLTLTNDNRYDVLNVFVSEILFKYKNMYFSLDSGKGFPLEPKDIDKL